jgi:CxxC motif-containing protein (DUF1111 family)
MRLPLRPLLATTALATTALATTALAAALMLAAVARADTPPFKKRPKLAPAPLASRGAPPAGPVYGLPLADLGAGELAAFEEGKEEFESVETPEGGLGPIFNGSSCAGCHSAGATGGASLQKVTRFGRLVGGVFDPMTSLGGSLLQALAIAPEAQERVPPQATIVAQRMSTPLFGAGLIEAIADADIEQNALRPQPDGVKGRVARITDAASGLPRVGRFGWKAQHATLLAFAGDAYLNEMGVTSRLFPHENAPNGNQALLDKYDLVPDIEDPVDPATGKSDIDHAADFMRFLAPPPPLRSTALTLAGAQLFAQIGCTACHLPAMVTAPHAVPALSSQVANLYSDLLLHDMGSLADGIAQDGASGREMRTAPLWGLRARTAFLHDGRASTVRAAIEQHEGQAAASRDRFKALNLTDKNRVLSFLGSL